MTTTDQKTSPALDTHDIAWQRFSIPYDFPVAFTRGIFDPANTLLADALSRRETDKRHRAMVYVDDGILGARPRLLEDIHAYAEAHADRIEILGIETDGLTAGSVIGFAE